MCLEKGHCPPEKGHIARCAVGNDPWQPGARARFQFFIGRCTWASVPGIPRLASCSDTNTKMETYLTGLPCQPVSCSDRYSSRCHRVQHTSCLICWWRSPALKLRRFHTQLAFFQNSPSANQRAPRERWMLQFYSPVCPIHGPATRRSRAGGFQWPHMFIGG